MDTPTDDEPDVMQLRRLLTVDDLAAYLSLPVATVMEWRVNG